MAAAPPADRASVFPAGEPWYPHAPRPTGAGRRGGEPPAVLRPADLERSWHLDFHYPRGVVPLGTALVGDVVAGAQRAARRLRLAESGGLAVRFAGPHVYVGSAPAVAVPERERAKARALTRRYPAVFPGRWRAARAALERELDALRRSDPAGLPPAEIGAYLRRARAVHAAAWRVHFAFMYRLLSCHEMLRAELAEAGVDEHTLIAVLQSADNRVLEVDRKLHALAARARADGLAPLFERDDGPLLPRLAARPAARDWLGAFTGFLAEHGHRADAMSDLTVPSWEEDPEQVLSLLRRIILGRVPPPRPPGAPAIPPGLTGRARELLREALRANVVSWNEDHNLVIEMRAHLPVRAGALALAAATGAPAPDEVLFLFPEEVDRLAAGSADWADLAERTAARRAYYHRWHALRAGLPRLLGTSTGLHDPVVSGVFCADPLRDRTAGPPAVLHGLGVSGGVARGRVRLVRSPDGLPDLRPGEVLVCEATTPTWTPLFGLVAACVCDTGGMLTHAAVISREYGIPCVCDVRTATATLRDGDEVEVDGTRGTVTLLARADRSP